MGSVSFIAVDKNMESACFLLSATIPLVIASYYHYMGWGLYGAEKGPYQQQLQDF